MFDRVLIRVNCNNCKKEIPIKISSYSRMDLENTLGTMFSVSCTHCFVRKEYHVNEVKAFENIIPIILFFTISIGVISLQILGLLVVQGVWLALLGFASPFAIYFIYKRGINQSVNTFNKHFITRETPYFPINPKRLK